MSEALLNAHCTRIAKGSAPLPAERARELLTQLHQAWTCNADNTRITREFRFRDFHQTMAFVNALAWVAHREDHHPDIEVGYNRCVVHYTTHAAAGLTDNDFICAARIDALQNGAD